MAGCYRVVALPAVLAALLGTARATPPPVPAYKEYVNWIAACDNVRTCAAKAIPDEANVAPAADPAAASLSITRDAGPAGSLSIHYFGERPGIPAATAVDAQAVADPLPWTVAGTGPDQVASLSGAPAFALLTRMRDGSTLLLTPPGGGPIPFSLAGLAATLLLFDDVQGRIGTVTALGRPGPQPAEAVPAAPPVPVVHAAARPPGLRGGKALAAAVRRGQAAALKAHDCDGADVADEDEAEPLTASEALVTLVCLRGAYQESSLVFRLPRAAPAQARLLHLPLPPGYPKRDRGNQGDLHTGASYDPGKATLGEFAKGRGLADCGLSAQWTFDGRDFQPSGYSSQDRCAGQPGDWPVLFRTRRAR